MSRVVVLAPGLWMPGGVMALLAARLRRRGYTTQVFAYRGRSPFDANVERMARFARERCGGGAHFVGHSLGGVLLLETLNRFPELAVHSAVLLGAPVRGCLAGRRLRQGRLGRWMMGACGSLWDERPALWRRKAPLGVVAGTVAVSLGRALGSLPGVNDGVVCVDETAVEGMAARALVGQAHSTLIVSGGVAQLVERFMQAGSFQ